jgi:hypothetical protein
MNGFSFFIIGLFVLAACFGDTLTLKTKLKVVGIIFLIFFILLEMIPMLGGYNA